MFLFLYLLFAFATVYGLWIFYLAVMNLQRVQKLGLLSPWALRFGYPVLVVGLFLDVVVNWFVVTLLLMEFPQELLVTARFKRHNLESTGWRKSVVLFFEPILDPFDPSGNHI